MSVSKTTIGAIACLSALWLSGCAATPEQIDTTATPESTKIPELEPIPDLPPPGFDESVEAAIEDSLPRVSYSPDSPDYLGPLVHVTPAERRALDRELIEGWIRELEALDGEATVICRSTPDDVFGHCSFPKPESTGDDDTPSN